MSHDKNAIPIAIWANAIWIQNFLIVDFRTEQNFSASFCIELLIFVVNLYETAILGQCWLVRCDGSSVSRHAIHLVTLIVDARSLSQIPQTKFNQKGKPGILYTVHKGYLQNRRENGCLENDWKLEPTFRGDQPPKYPKYPLLLAEEQNRDRMGWQKEQDNRQLMTMFSVYVYCLFWYDHWSNRGGERNLPGDCETISHATEWNQFWTSDFFGRQSFLSSVRFPFFFTNRWNSSKSSV